MKKIYAFAALFIICSLVITVFSACNKNNTEPVSTTVTTEQSIQFSTNVDGTAYSQGDDGYKYVITTTVKISEEKITQSNVTGHTVITLPPLEQTTKVNKITTKENISEKSNVSKQNISNETIKEESKGISVLFKSDGVSKGSSATISVIGEAGKTYSIDFYKNANTISDANGLGDMKADENGMVIWTFEIENDCEAGNRKIIIKEKGSDNFVQTSINIK